MVNDPITQLGREANLLHEAYTEYVKAGFSDKQALYLLASAVTKNPGPTPEGAE